MFGSAPLLLLTGSCVLSSASAACLGTQPAVFYDMHDGDMKLVTPAPMPSLEFAIQPYNNSESWLVYGTFDDNCEASVDFNVPHKPNPPPVNLTLTMWIMMSTDGVYSTLGLEFTDPTSTVAPAQEPVNFWMQGSWPKPNSIESKGALNQDEESISESCIETTAFHDFLVHDMHDGDMKALKETRGTLHIKPYHNNQSWAVDAKFGADCAANVDFNVPGKPEPPPVPLSTRVWGLESIAGASKNALIFTDPSGTIASAKAPINAWVPDNKNIE